MNCARATWLYLAIHDNPRHVANFGMSCWDIIGLASIPDDQNAPPLPDTSRAAMRELDGGETFAWLNVMRRISMQAEYVRMRDMGITL